MKLLGICGLYLLILPSFGVPRHAGLSEGNRAATLTDSVIVTSDSLLIRIAEIRRTQTTIVPPSLGIGAPQKPVNPASGQTNAPPKSYRECTGGFYPIRVCADGSQALLFKFFGGTWKGYYHLMAARIKEGSDPDKYGVFTILPATSPDTLQVVYRNPTYIDVADAMNAPSLFTVLTMETYFPTIQGYNHVEYYNMNVYRPPVFMVHGLWGSREAFDKMASALVATGFYSKEFLYQADYSSTNTLHFQVNKVIVENQIKEYLNTLTDPNVCIGVSKVDYVAHSMGGILGRLYLQSDTYQDNIYRLVTINTPHAGSQMANVLRSPLRKPANEKTCATIYLDAAVSFFTDACGNGAVDDLKVDSDAIRVLLNGSQRTRRSVPSHAIATTATFSTLLASGRLFKQPFDSNIGYGTQYKLSINFDDIFGEPNDNTVALSSQYGGLPCRSLFPGQVHTASPNNSLVITRVYSMLIDRPTSSWFCNTVFDPPRLSPPVLAPLPSGALTTAAVTESLRIITPAKGTLVYAGSPITVSISGTGVADVLASSAFDQDSVLLGLLNQGVTTFNIPTSPKLLGKKYIAAFGKLPNGDFLIDTSYFYVVNNCATLKSGNWTDASVWSCGHQPTVNDIATVNANHVIAITTKTAYTRKVTYNGGRLSFSYPGVRLSTGLDIGIVEPPNSLSITDFSNTLTLLTLGSNASLNGSNMSLAYTPSNGGKSEFRTTNPFSFTNGFETSFTFRAVQGQKLVFKITNPADGTSMYIGALLSTTDTQGISTIPANSIGYSPARTVFDGQDHTLKLVAVNNPYGTGSSITAYLDGTTSAYGFSMYYQSSSTPLSVLFNSPRYVGIMAFHDPPGNGQILIKNWVFKAY